MKYKGVEFLAGSVGGYVIYKILDYVEPQIVNTVLTLNGVSLLLLVDFAFLSLSGFGVFLILNGKYRWLKGKTPNVEQNQVTLEQREKHSKELNDKIFKRLSTISIREDKHYNYGLYVKKDETQDDLRFANIIYAKTDDTVIPLDKLPNVFYEWALKHLEHKEYSDKILKPFNQLQEWIDQYNKKETTQRETLEKQIDKVVNESFKDCTIYPKTIRKRLESEIFVENHDHRFGDLIIDRISNHYAIMPRGYPIEHPYIICESITTEQLESFKTILNSIINSEEFLHTDSEQNILLFKKIEPLLKELGNNFQRLSAELGATGSIIEGNCKLPY